MRTFIALLLLGATSVFAAPEPPKDWLSKGPHAFEEVVALLSLVPSGERLNEKLKKLQKQGALTLLSTRSDEAKLLGIDAGVAGLYYRNQIFLDESTPLIALLATLAHEGEHAVEYLAEEKGKEKETALRKIDATSIQILMTAEERGYRAQDVFLKELIEAFPSAKAAVDSAVSHRYLVAYPTTREQLRDILIRGMLIPSADVDGFLKNEKR